MQYDWPGNIRELQKYDRAGAESVHQNYVDSGGFAGRNLSASSLASS